MNHWTPTPYAPRPTELQGVLRHGDWRLRHWTIRYGDGSLAVERFTGGRARAFESLPTPAVAMGRPGVGVLIEHQGNGADYVVLAWWDRENELPIRVFIRDGEAWRVARGGESVCVWDLEVLWREREAYVRHVLGPNGPDVGAYLDA